MTGRGSSLATGRMRTFTRPMTSVCQDLHRACSDRSVDGSGRWGTAGRAAEWLGSHLRSLSLVLPSESVWENDVFRTETRTAWYLVSCIVSMRAVHELVPQLYPQPPLLSCGSLPQGCMPQLDASLPAPEYLHQEPEDLVPPPGIQSVPPPLRHPSVLS